MLLAGDTFGTKHPLDPCKYAMEGQPVILEQWTGLVDCKGVDIYEGDIVSIPLAATRFSTGVMKFNRGSFGVDLDRNDNLWGPNLHSDDMEIIGHIHEVKE